MQLINAIYLAEKWGINRVHACNLGTIFKPGIYEYAGKVQIVINQPDDLPVVSLCGRFFCWWGVGGSLREMKPEKAANIVQLAIKKMIAFSPSIVGSSRPTIHVHMRGGSDIFGSSAQPLGQVGVLNKHYVQPPLSYYKICVDEFLSRHPGGEVVIVSMDRAKESLDKRGLGGGSDQKSEPLPAITSETICCDLLASCSIILGWFLRLNRGVQTHQAPGQAAASNCRRAWNRFDSAASTLILQRF